MDQVNIISVLFQAFNDIFMMHFTFYLIGVVAYFTYYNYSIHVEEIFNVRQQLDGYEKILNDGYKVFICMICFY